jgi:uncharacterized protein YcfJ
MKSCFTLFLTVGAMLALVGCAAQHPDPYVRQGRRTGTATGAVAGAIIGNNVDGMSSAEGAVAGALVGGLVGDQRGKVNSMYHRGY